MVTSAPEATASPIISPDLVRYARLRRFGLSASTLRIIAFHAFGDCSERLLCAPAAHGAPLEIGGVHRG